MGDSSYRTITHTISVLLVKRLARVAFNEQLSRSSILEHALRRLFRQFPADAELAAHLHEAGAVRKRKKQK